ncbi:MAG: heavy-metal-associated domain-containing protein [Flavobacteriales bacterium]
MKNILMKSQVAIVCLVIMIIATSCSNTAKNDAASNEPDVKTVVMEIEGMTCEVGCKNAIEKKVAKMEGIQSIQIDFENATAEVAYDERVTNPEEVIETIESIGGGLYTAKVVLAQKD